MGPMGFLAAYCEEGRGGKIKRSGGKDTGGEDSVHGLGWGVAIIVDSITHPWYLTNGEPCDRFLFPNAVPSRNRSVASRMNPSHRRG